MEFSEAIRLGALLTQPLRWALAIFDPVTKEPLATCALGAAAHAVGVLQCGRYARMVDAFPAAHEPREIPCQVCGYVTSNLASYAAHLNDVHGYARANVADLIEREEQRLAAGVLSDHVVDAFMATAPAPDSARTARIRDQFNAKKDAASPVSK
jgi:hypothetical protein